MSVDWRALLPDDLLACLRELTTVPPTVVDDADEPRTVELCTLCGVQYPPAEPEKIDHRSDCPVAVIARYFPDFIESATRVN